MLLGICLADVAAAKGPLGTDIKWNSIGHGYYLFRSNSYVFSHTDAAVNNKQKSFSFSAGESVEVRYDPVGGRVRATKGSQQYELTVPAGDYRLCTVMAYSGESVTMEMK